MSIVVQGSPRNGGMGPRQAMQTGPGIGRQWRPVLTGLMLAAGTAQAGATNRWDVDGVEARYVVADNPALHHVGRGLGYDGVAELVVETGTESLGGCGALLLTGRHILTAAHLVDSAVRATVVFDLPGGSEIREAVAFHVYPGWTGDLLAGGDLAIVELDRNASVAADRYDLYRGNDEVGRVGFKAGYGKTGTGNTGYTQTPPEGTKVGGGNRYDALADLFNELFFSPGSIPAGTQLAYDFDSGLAANDAFGYFFGISDLGLGPQEVNSAPGDSGGPTFLDGRIAGVTSYGFGFHGDPDVWDGGNSSFGEFSVDTRVSTYVGWIDSVVPEPTTAFMMAAGILWAGRRQREKRTG